MPVVTLTYETASGDRQALSVRHPDQSIATLEDQAREVLPKGAMVVKMESSRDDSGPEHGVPG